MSYKNEIMLLELSYIFVTYPQFRYNKVYYFVFFIGYYLNL